jgi:hypothetical protein
MNMRGSIRAIVGLLVLFGVAGGLDTATDTQLIPLVVIGLVGALVMYSGVTAMNTPTGRRGI